VINQIIETLGSNASRNFKIDVLNQHKDNDLLKRVCFLALDPFTQFYIRKIPVYEFKGGPSVDLGYALDELSKLSTRQLTGNAGINFLSNLLGSLVVDDSRVLELIIQKDLRCGVSDSTVNKVWPNLIAEYPCMLASAFDQKLIDKIKFPAMVQLKLDGMRFNAIVRNGAVEFRSRNGKEIQIADPSFALPFITMSAGTDVVFDGELLCRDRLGIVMDRKTGNGILNKAVKGTQSLAEGQLVCAQLWDVIPFDTFNKGKGNLPYSQRFADLIRLRSLANDHRIEIVENTYVDTLDQARELFEKYLADGQEGIILKTKDMIWENKRSKHQIKFKGELECDLKVVDWVEGTGKNVGRMGALILESADSLVRVGVGTGFSDGDRIAISRGDIGRIVAVKYNARISDKRSEVDSLFLPVFVEFRDDKDVADSSKDIK
jgi:hypothetical protein